MIVAVLVVQLFIRPTVFGAEGDTSVDLITGTMAQGLGFLSAALATGMSALGAGVAVAAAAPISSALRTGEEIYVNACTTCHSIGLAGAPKFADASTWGVRPDKGIAALTMSVKNGLNGMPPKGMCMDCSEDELSSAVQHMLDSL